MPGGAAGAGGVGGAGGASPAAAAAAMNAALGRSNYSVVISESGHQQPTPFPPDYNKGPDIPVRVSEFATLDHGDVVCAVTISNNNKFVYTGGKVSILYENFHCPLS